MLKSFYLIRPAVEPALDLSELKLFLKIDNDSEDNLLRRLIHTATNQFERYTGQVLIKQLWKAIFQRVTSRRIKLPVLPAISLETITMSSWVNKKIQFDLHNAELDSTTGIVTFKVAPLCQELSIDYYAGFGGDLKDIPDEIGSLLLSHVGHLYENRVNGKPFPLSVYEPFRIHRL